MFRRNVGIFLSYYILSHPRRHCYSALEITRVNAEQIIFITDKAEFCQSEQKQQSPLTYLNGKLYFINAIVSKIWDTRENTGRRSF
jgi:hypothetical protein